ncbi:Hypothetical Protein FCC1311_112392 [Hondaea fermentalgiana]|uniref:Uncharacterized protein n=1 Tax=Hondaea fermentalgiana TaxID=2315210 RepID=A0A2R5GW02_9STRA|nr:Hypothetical Protein FCC1311_112392 [Hondaea fermentalgiana]|eukprot:GBG35016.1 Hypothetical Protein FCC1311_112392 [Hondaea fermentalgiana]
MGVRQAALAVVAVVVAVANSGVEAARYEDNLLTEFTFSQAECKARAFADSVTENYLGGLTHLSEELGHHHEWPMELMVALVAEWCTSELLTPFKSPCQWWENMVFAEFWSEAEEDLKYLLRDFASLIHNERRWAAAAFIPQAPCGLSAELALIAKADDATGVVRRSPPAGCNFHDAEPPLVAQTYDTLGVARGGAMPSARLNLFATELCLTKVGAPPSHLCKDIIIYELSDCTHEDMARAAKPEAQFGEIGIIQCLSRTRKIFVAVARFSPVDLRRIDYNKETSRMHVEPEPMQDVSDVIPTSYQAIELPTDDGVSTLGPFFVSADSSVLATGSLEAPKELDESMAQRLRQQCSVKALQTRERFFERLADMNPRHIEKLQKSKRSIQVKIEGNKTLMRSNTNENTRQCILDTLSTDLTKICTVCTLVPVPSSLEMWWHQLAGKCEVRRWA